VAQQCSIKVSHSRTELKIVGEAGAGGGLRALGFERGKGKDDQRHAEFFFQLFQHYYRDSVHALVKRKGASAARGNEMKSQENKGVWGEWISYRV